MNDQLDLLPAVRDDVPDPVEEKERCAQLTSLPGTEFEHIFACQIDESAGLREDTA